MRRSQDGERGFDPVSPPRTILQDFETVPVSIYFEVTYRLIERPWK
jgi:hypothetical protein